MLQLPTVTLLSIDAINPDRMLNAMAQTLRLVAPAAAVLLTDLTRHQNVTKRASTLGISTYHHPQSNRFVTYPGVPRKYFIDYELAHMQQPSQHMGSSSHVLYMEYDAGVLNPLAWQPSWLTYDYIGAPWHPHFDPGWPACDGITNAVGNSGFSLRSREFCHVITDILRTSTDPVRYGSDSWMCRTLRPTLESEHSLKFAPIPVASAFSCENRIYSGQFGYHGRATIALNGWGLWLHDIATNPK